MWYVFLASSEHLSSIHSLAFRLNQPTELSSADLLSQPGSYGME